MQVTPEVDKKPGLPSASVLSRHGKQPAPSIPLRSTLPFLSPLFCLVFLYVSLLLLAIQDTHNGFDISERFNGPFHARIFFISISFRNTHFYQTNICNNRKIISLELLII